MDTVIIEIDKENKFQRTHIIKNDTIEDAERRIIPVNEKAGFIKAYVVKDQHIIDALLAKESERSMKFYAKAISEEIKDLQYEMHQRISSLDCYNDTLQELIEELKAGAN